MNNIYLVGFMATGKTSVGIELAKKKKRQFVDLDELIELREKRQIRDIFAKDGEQYFRKVEKQVLREVVKEDNFVVACGGGSVIDPDNIKIMKQTGKVICLTASVETIINRASGLTHRPLLDVADQKKQVETLLKLRSPYYAQADKTIDTTGLSIEQAVLGIIKLTSTRSKAGLTKKIPKQVKRRKRNVK